MQILVMDGQGGKMGRAIVEQLKIRFPQQRLVVVGTNSIATATMLKAGADQGATGENPVVVCAATADLIIGPIGILVANSLLGEVTPSMAVAVGSSPAQKILIPSNQCNNHVVGTTALPLAELVALAVNQVDYYLKNGSC